MSTESNQLPKTPGLHWWRRNAEREFAVEEVFEINGDLYVPSLAGRRSVASLGGEWGGRVPSHAEWTHAIHVMKETSLALCTLDLTNGLNRADLVEMLDATVANAEGV